MKLGRVFLSGCTVYVIVAACSAMDPGRGTGGSAGQGDLASSGVNGGSSIAGSGGRSGTGGTGGAAGAGGRGGFGGIMDPVPPASADPTNGARLKAKLWSGADGSMQYVPGEWHDSTLADDCAPSEPWFGVVRCVPSRMASLNTSGEFYSDASCTQLITNVPSCRSSQSYVYKPYGSNGDCVSDMHVYPIIERREFDSFYRLTDMTCEEVHPPSRRAITVIGPEMQPSSFVELTLRVVP